MSRPIAFAAFLLLLAIGWIAYAPGLHGSFLFDDFNNLSQLGAYGRVDNFRTLLLYLSSGNADPTGRPLALLSFLLDANDWPADPVSFKRTNIFLHLLNGTLLSVVLLKLGARLCVGEKQVRGAAILGAALWTLHPFFVSTTLYIIQREAMLPATLCLFAMLLWLEGTQRLLAGRGGAAAYMVAGAWGCTALATMAKANGALIPLLLLVMDWTIPHKTTMPVSAATSHKLKWLRTGLLGLPSTLIALWLGSKLPTLFGDESFIRPWTIGQRLLTEPRVICDYLRLLWLPRATGTSLFNDSYAASTDLLHPWTTLPALAAVLLLAATGFVIRRRHPALAFAILFYFAGQLMESTVIPLELYFEHRNYLPALVMFWPLALWLFSNGPLPVTRHALAFALPLAFAALCHARAGIWGKPSEQAQLLAELDPTSTRAQAYLATVESEQGHPDLAQSRLKKALTHAPTEAQLALNLATAECRTGGISPATVKSAEFALGNDKVQAELVQNWLTNAIGAARNGECRGLDLPTVDGMVEAMRDNPYYSKGAGHQHDIYQLKGRLALARNNGTEALSQFDAGLAAFPTPDGALVQAALLGQSGFPALGLQHLDYFASLPPAGRNLQGMAALHLWLLGKEGYWTMEFAAMRKQLEEDAASKAGGALQ